MSGSSEIDIYNRQIVDRAGIFEFKEHTALMPGCHLILGLKLGGKVQKSFKIPNFSSGETRDKD